MRNTDGGDVDRLAMLAVNDIADFWGQNFSGSLQGTFKPISDYLSYDANDRSSPKACGETTYKLVNAFYCPSEDLMAWDRGTLVPGAREFFGDMSVNALIAHEYGHAVQRMAGLVSNSTPTLVMEQQADCFSGVYMRWVAEGKSSRFTLSTTEGLDYVLAAAIDIRDPTITPEYSELLENGHGTALDRVSAFQIGFDTGAEGCAKIDMDEITQRRGNLPMSLQVTSDGQLESGQVDIDDDTLSTLMEILNEVFKPTNAPKLSTNTGDCPGMKPDEKTPAVYCASNNTIVVDLPALQKMGAKKDESQMVLVQGDNTALSFLTSRYALAVQHDRGSAIDTPVAALRTACLTGVAQAAMDSAVSVPSGKTLVLTAGDSDEAVSGLLTNGLVASDVNGKTVRAGFTRIEAYRQGLLGDADQCYKRFSWGE